MVGILLATHGDFAEGIKMSVSMLFVFISRTRILSIEYPLIEFMSISLFFIEYT